LKKTLTLALVFVMAIGLLSAGAVDFTDADDIQYAEAVEVMVNLGAINGYPDGTFNPDGLVTRAEAAKLVTYAILTPRVAEYLPKGTSSFDDVPANHWAAPYIEYCVSQGIVNGRGNGKFDPNGNVTAFELAKMLLTAAGYGRNNEYVGATWSLNVVTDAIDNGIFTGTKATNYGAPATREEAALYVFNGLTKVDQVKFSKDTESYVLTVDGGQTIGEQKYGLYTDDIVVNGVMGYIWKNGAGTELSSFVLKENVLGTSTDGTSIANLSKKSESEFIAELDSVVQYVRNGSIIPEYKDNDVYDKDALVSYKGVLYVVKDAGGLKADDTYTALTGDTPKADVYTIRKGVIVNFINTDFDAKVEKISITEKIVAQVGANPYVSPVTGQVTIAGVGDQVFDKDKVVYPADLARNDWVLFYKDASGVTRIEKATVVKGEMTSANTTRKTITFAGDSYAESGLVTEDSVVPAFYNNANNFNAAATAYLDNNGDIIYIARDTVTGPATTYGLLVGYDFTAGSGGFFGTPSSAKALLYTADGKVAVYDVAADPATGVVPNQGVDKGGVDGTEDFTFSGVFGYLVSYRINSDGEVTLTPAGDGDTLSADYTARTATMKLETKGNIYITSDTKVIYFDASKAYDPDNSDSIVNLAKFVTGFGNTSAADEDKNVTYVIKSGSTNVAEVVFVSVAPAEVEIPGQYAYVHSIIRGESKRIVDGVEYYDYTVFVNGVATTLTSKTSGLFANPGLYKYTLNSEGYVASAPAETAIVDGEVTYVDTGFVGYLDGQESKSVPVTASTKYYLVSLTGISEAPIAASTTYVDYNIVGIEVADEVATAIYFTINYR